MATSGYLPKEPSVTAGFGLNKTINEYRGGYINSFVFISAVRLSYSVHAPVLWDYPVCIPFKRVKQLRATADGFEPVSPSTWNLLLVYGPPVDQTRYLISIKLLCSTTRSVM